MLKYLINWSVTLAIFLVASYGGMSLLGPFGLIVGVIAGGAYASATDLVWNNVEIQLRRNKLHELSIVARAD
jgi:hypothetical protein